MDDAKGCMGANCGALKTQSPDVGNKCTVRKVVDEDAEGWLEELPGMGMGMGM